MMQKSWLNLHRLRPEIRHKILEMLARDRSLRAADDPIPRSKLDNSKDPFARLTFVHLKAKAKIDKSKYAAKALANAAYRTKIVKFLYKRIGDNPAEVVGKIKSPILKDKDMAENTLPKNLPLIPESNENPLTQDAAVFSVPVTRMNYPPLQPIYYHFDGPMLYDWVWYRR
ncbi:unnamed protein product, partial [Mesorhabditis spiculigera]